MNPPIRPTGVLLMSNDLLTPFAKTTDYLAAAIERRGIPAYIRDNADARMLTYLFSQEMAPNAPRAQEAICDGLRELIQYAEIDTVLGLDLNWYVTPGLFIDDAAIRNVHSLWFDDFRSWCTSASNPIFPVDGDVFQKNIKSPKVMHHFYGDSQALEAKLLGFTSQRITRLAAPRHLLDCDAPCTKTGKLAFIGNPGFRGAPHPEAVELMQSGADIGELRAYCSDAILKYPEEKPRTGSRKNQPFTNSWPWRWRRDDDFHTGRHCKFYSWWATIVPVPSSTPMRRESSSTSHFS
jgi:hypothetical protein